MKAEWTALQRVATWAAMTVGKLASKMAQLKADSKAAHWAHRLAAQLAVTTAVMMAATRVLMSVEMKAGCWDMS